MSTQRVSNGWVFGLIVSVLVGAFLALIIGWLLKTSLSMVVSITLLIGVIFFYFGLRNLLVGYEGSLLFLGKRYRNWATSEGWVWWFPWPIGDIIPIDIRRRPLEVNPTNVLSADGTPIGVDISLEVQTDNPSIYLGVTDADQLLVQLADKITREVIGILTNDEILNNPQNIIKILTAVFQNGTVGTTPNITGSQEARDLAKRCFEDLEIGRIGDKSQNEWGVSVLQFFVTDLRFPAEIETARNQASIEKAQRTSENIELDNFKEMLKKLMNDTGLTAMEAANLIQVERGKGTKVVIEGSALPLVQAAALIGQNSQSNNNQTGG